MTRIRWRMIALALLGAMACSDNPGNAPTGLGSPAAPAAALVFAPGDRVKTGGTANVRSGPAASATLLGAQPAGALGTFLGGPIVDSAGDGLLRWQVNFDQGPDGWVAEPYAALSLVTTAAPVASVTVTPATASLAVGATVQLLATTKDAAGTTLSGRAITWTSGNTGVATVSTTGLVRGVAAGSVAITATSEGKSGSATVTVSATTAKFVPGDRVQTSGTANIRSGPAGSATLVGTQPAGALGTIVGGPVVDVSGDGLERWQVDFDQGVDGWAAEPYAGLVKVGSTPPAPPPPPPPPSGSVVLVGAGDIGDCGTSTDEATAKLLDGIAGTIFTAGDNAYPNGTASDFSNCYAPTWGRHRARTRPSPGNHDYNTSGAAAYYAYFGAAAGVSGRGYYSYDLGDWHIIALNSNVAMGAGSAQLQWLTADLAANTKRCTLAYWHHPRFSSGSHGSSTTPRPLWDALYAAGAEIVVSGHDHNYERFAPQTPAGAADPLRGIREFIVGTGGTALRSIGAGIANSEVRSSAAHGVLKLTLSTDAYAWEFVPVAGKTFSDRGTGACH